MARRTNYGFEKRQKEIKQQKKKEEKAEKKRLKREAAASDAQGEPLAGGVGSHEATGDAPADDRDGG